MEDEVNKNKYSEILKGLDFEHLVYERAILDRKKDNLYIMDKELKKGEFKGYNKWKQCLGT